MKLLGAVAACALLAACTSSATPSATPTGTTQSVSTIPAGTRASTPGSPAGTAAAPAPRTVTVLGSGDVLIHPPLIDQARADGADGALDFRPMLADIAPDVRRADVATCELETPLAKPGGPYTGWPTFNAPGQVLTALKAVGYDSCTTASNHTIDQGSDGVRRTLDQLDAAGLKHTGSARSASEAATPLIETTADGAKVAQLAYTFGFNGLSLPSDQPWLSNPIDVPTILAAAHRAKQAGADVVVLSLHWGVEYNSGATDEQKSQARELLASPDVDLILGDHPHVVEPAEKIHGKWVFYSMGNQLARHADPVLPSREGAMPLVTFTEAKDGTWHATRAEVVPTLMQLAPQLRLIDLRQALADPDTSDADRATYQASVAHVRATLNAYGAGRDGLVIP